MPDPNCPHVTLKRKNVGPNIRWYQCEVCGQKFQAKEWDGKVGVTYPTEERSTEKEGKGTR